jgi:hypothetical protein
MAQEAFPAVKTAILVDPAILDARRTTFTKTLGKIQQRAWLADGLLCSITSDPFYGRVPGCYYTFAVKGKNAVSH